MKQELEDTLVNNMSKSKVRESMRELSAEEIITVEDYKGIENLIKIRNERIIYE